MIFLLLDVFCLGFSMIIVAPASFGQLGLVGGAGLIASGGQIGRGAWSEGARCCNARISGRNGVS